MRNTRDGGKSTRWEIRRRGVVLAIVIVVLVVAAMLAVGLSRLLVAQHQLQATQQRYFQTVELARAGVERARVRLAQSPDYAGETWEVDAEALALPGDTSVAIEVAAIDGHAARRSITARATCGQGAEMLQHTQQIDIHLQTPESE